MYLDSSGLVPNLSISLLMRCSVSCKLVMWLLALMPGMVQCLIVGMLFEVAVNMCWLKSSMMVSILWSVG